MNEEFLEKIRDQEEVLATLPKNNKKNKEKYLRVVSDLKNEYLSYLNTFKEEILSRSKKIDSIKENPALLNKMTSINTLADELKFLSSSAGSYELLGLDKVIYNISRYYNYNLDDVNENIMEALSIFKSVGVELKVTDFNYSFFVNTYMMELLGGKKPQELKSIFDSIYWKCSDILFHLELNFKNLYWKNKKAFDTYCEVKLKEILKGKTKEEYWNNYKTMVIKYDQEVENDVYTIIQKFKNKELIMPDFSIARIESILKNMFNTKEFSELNIADIKKFYYSIDEYQDYLDVLYIFESILKLVDAPAGKNESKTTLKNIRGKESKLNRLNNKIRYAQSKNKDIGKMLVDLHKLISELKELYDKLDTDVFIDKLKLNINDSSTYYDILELIANNYVYLIKIIKETDEEITKDEINLKIKKIKEILLSPYNTFINNLSIKSEKDIKMIISDCYKLSNFNVTPEVFDDEAELDNMKGNIEKIIVYNTINKSNVTFEEIEFYLNALDMVVEK